MVMTDSKVNNSWADPYSTDYRSDITQLIENVATSKTTLAKNVWHINVEREDLISELYCYLLSKPSLIEDGKVPSKILHNRASNFCFKQRLDKGAAIVGTDTLHDMLLEFNKLPTYILDVLYGPVFAKAGKPVGTYLEIIEQEYKYKNKVVGASNRKTLARAVARLAEVISGIMVGTPDSFNSLTYAANVPSYEMQDNSDDSLDSTFAPFTAIYTCTNNHSYRINTGAKPDTTRIGQNHLLGYYKCKCGEVLELDSRN